ncbi:unnamed protein product, partial [Ectocarpus sp. 8 AP-2014]
PPQPRTQQPPLDAMAFVSLPTARFDPGAGFVGIVRPRAPWYHNAVGSATPRPRGGGSALGGCATCGATTPDSSSGSQRAASLMSVSAGGYSRRSSRAGSTSAARPNGTESVGGGGQVRRRRGTDNPHSRLFVKKVKAMESSG